MSALEHMIRHEMQQLSYGRETARRMLHTVILWLEANGVGHFEAKFQFEGLGIRFAQDL